MLPIARSVMLSSSARRCARLWLVALACVSTVFAATPTRAAVPGTLSYQGVLTDGAGAHVADGNYAVTFSLYDVAAGGVALWTETQPAVPVTSGLFSALLGSTTPIGLAFDRQYYLGISVGASAELSPRTALSSVPYAMATRTPTPAIATAHYPGSYSVIGNANFGNPIQLAMDVSVNVTAPTDGYVVVNATGYLTMVLVTTGSSQYGVLQVAETTGLSGIAVNAESGHFQWIGFQFAPNNGYWDWSFAVQRAFPVTAGTHRYSFCTARYGSYSPTGTSITNLNMVATFFPTTVGTVAGVPAGINDSAELTPRVVQVATGPRVTPPASADAPR
jgi:hypothetical protein